MTNLKAQKAYSLHGKGNLDEARKLYQEAYENGLDNPKFLISYAVLLFKNREFEKAADVLRRTDKLAGIRPEHKAQVFVYYAACVFKMGQVDKGIRLLEKQHRRQPGGSVYQTLGILYVEKFDAAQKPDFAELDRKAMEDWQKAREQAVNAQVEEQDEVENDLPAVSEEPPKPSEEEWKEGIEKADAFLREAIDYDDEDPIYLDNYAQFLYRVKGDKEQARKYFKRALAIKPTQIDTLYFLAKYDIEDGKLADAREKLETASEGKFSPLNFATREKVDELLKSIESGKEA